MVLDEAGRDRFPTRERVWLDAVADDAVAEVRQILAVGELGHRDDGLGECAARGKRNDEAARVRELTQQLHDIAPPTLDGKSSAINKLKPKSSAFYDQVDFLHSCLVRYNQTDVPHLKSYRGHTAQARAQR